LVRALALCNKCRVPKYEEIKKEQIYKVVSSDYLISGGDGYSMFLNKESSTKGEDALEVLEKYFQKMSPVTTPDEGRTIEVSTSKDYTKTDDCSSASFISLNPIFIVVFLLISSFI